MKKMIKQISVACNDLESLLCDLGYNDYSIDNVRKGLHEKYSSTLIQHHQLMDYLEEHNMKPTIDEVEYSCYVDQLLDYPIAIYNGSENAEMLEAESADEKRARYIAEETEYLADYWPFNELAEKYGWEKVIDGIDNYKADYGQNGWDTLTECDAETVVERLYLDEE